MIHKDGRDCSVLLAGTWEVERCSGHGLIYSLGIDGAKGAWLIRSPEGICSFSLLARAQGTDHNHLAHI